jgi:hypothetical protein
MLAWTGGVVTMVEKFLRSLLIGKDAQLPVLFLFFASSAASPPMG